jgi:hypothetical protein
VGAFIMREHPRHVLERMQACVNARGVIVISAITYSEMRFGTIGPKASARHAGMITSGKITSSGKLKIQYGMSEIRVSTPKVAVPRSSPA